MSEEAVSRVNCWAYHCPGLGVMTRDIGSKKWLCGCHFGVEPDDWGTVTQELLRLKWLVEIVRSIREGAMHPHGWVSVEVEAHKEMMLAQRGDLKRGDHEPINKWVARLEGVLSTSCIEAAKQQNLSGVQNV